MLLNLGECPKCNKNTLEHIGLLDISGTSCIYRIKCTECKWKGLEWYDMSFIGYTDSQGNEI